MNIPQQSGYPAVKETPDNAVMLGAWRESGILKLQRCGGCGTVVFYPRAICPNCWSERLGWFAASGKGIVRSYTMIYRGLPEAFEKEAPIVLAEIELHEGALMIARIIHPDAEKLQTGAAVALVPSSQAHLYPLPTFGPADVSGHG